MNHVRPSLSLGLAASLIFSISGFSADRVPPPTRPFDAPGAPKFTRLDGKPGVNPPVDADGDFLVGPEYAAAPETKVVEGVPQGKVQQFSIDSKDCKLFNPGIARNVLGPSIRTTPRR